MTPDEWAALRPGTMVWESPLVSMGERGRPVLIITQATYQVERRSGKTVFLARILDDSLGTPVGYRADSISKFHLSEWESYRATLRDRRASRDLYATLARRYEESERQLAEFIAQKFGVKDVLDATET